MAVKIVHHPVQPSPVGCSRRRRPGADRDQVPAVVAADTPKGKRAEKFFRRRRGASPRAVKVEVYANSTLYKDKEEIEALQLGCSADALAPSLAVRPLGVKGVRGLDLPTFFDYTELHWVTQGRWAPAS